ncbi:hypothetical protein BC937DRAFT_91445 [Endogone sp. FLAS-F59071]|nr:hypothetical protein BC937DRAFT_91445 [Endogone sp. FLAS-F59071]|eukprot:RUS16249.1 hypothetical protein BC937DRAFT_91445 [Endogone sp. FLAS-F59071]
MADMTNLNDVYADPAEYYTTGNNNNKYINRVRTFNAVGIRTSPPSVFSLPPRALATFGVHSIAARQSTRGRDRRLKRISLGGEGRLTEPSLMMLPPSGWRRVG